MSWCVLVFGQGLHLVPKAPEQSVLLQRIASARIVSRTSMIPAASRKATLTLDAGLNLRQFSPNGTVSAVAEMNFNGEIS